MIDEDHTVDVICLHFAKAFESVIHRFLLAKMKYFGLVDVVVRWIEAYLTDRVLRVHVDGELSRTIPMCNGVPRGSVIGPLLFPTFVKDLPDTLEVLTPFFADNIKMVTQRTENMSLHSSPIAAWDWPKKWDLLINPTKCNYLTIGLEISRRLYFFCDELGTSSLCSNYLRNQGSRQIMYPLLPHSAQCTAAANKEKTTDLPD